MELSQAIRTGIIFISIGFVLGILVSAAIASMRKSPRPSLPKPQAQPQERPGREALSIWESMDGTSLSAELDGKVLPPKGKLKKAQRERLAEMVTFLSQWAPPAAAPAAAPPPVEVKPSPTPFADSLPKPGGIREGLRLSPLDKIGTATRPRPDVSPPSIIAQIDDILQEKLVGTPLENEAIQLFESPTKGMVIMVGLDRYQGIDEIPDPAVQAIIQDAVGEWNRRQSLKR